MSTKRTPPARGIPRGMGVGRGGPARLSPVQPRTMVDQAAEAIIAGATRGLFLPGDRLVEAEIARDLGISRVPVREALRLLESQGVVVSEAYKGMRLMPLSNRGVAELMRVRLALETLALQEGLHAGEPARFDELADAVATEARLPRGAGAAARAGANTQVHRALCRAARNDLLVAVWNRLATQLAVVWSLGEATRDAAQERAGHARILAAARAGDLPDAIAELTRHIEWHLGHDYEAALRQRRAGG